MFERNHNLIPLIDADDYELGVYIDGKKGESIDLTLEDLKKFPSH